MVSSRDTASEGGYLDRSNIQAKTPLECCREMNMALGKGSAPVNHVPSHSLRGRGMEFYIRKRD